jgi:hypothetical protein
MAAFSLNKKSKTNKKQPINFGRKTAERPNKVRASSTDTNPDETKVPGSDRDPSQTPIQPNAEKSVLNRSKNTIRYLSSKFKHIRGKAMVGVWNIVVI